MKRYFIILLAVLTGVIAYVEYHTVGLPSLNGTIFDFFSLYIPAAFMTFSVIALIMRTNRVSRILWAVFSATVTTLSAFIWSYLPVYLEPVMNDESISTSSLLTLMGVTIFYIVLMPVVAIAIYLYSISEWPKNWKW